MQQEKEMVFDHAKTFFNSNVNRNLKNYFLRRSPFIFHSGTEVQKMSPQPF